MPNPKSQSNQHLFSDDHEGKKFRGFFGHKCPSCKRLGGTIDAGDYRFCNRCELAFMRTAKNLWVGVDWGSAIDEVITYQIIDEYQLINELSVDPMEFQEDWDFLLGDDDEDDPDATQEIMEAT